ncbi:MAG TPA: hypothetical protein VIX82_00345, partial [Solirubrobacteraceae bacterium]
MPRVMNSSTFERARPVNQLPQPLPDTGQVARIADVEAAAALNRRELRRYLDRVTGRWPIDVAV